MLHTRRLSRHLSLLLSLSLSWHCHANVFSIRIIIHVLLLVCIHWRDATTSTCIFESELQQLCFSLFCEKRKYNFPRYIIAKREHAARISISLNTASREQTARAF